MAQFRKAPPPLSRGGPLLTLAGLRLSHACDVDRLGLHPSKVVDRCVSSQVHRSLLQLPPSINATISDTPQHDTRVTVERGERPSRARPHTHARTASKAARAARKGSTQSLVCAATRSPAARSAISRSAQI